VANLANPRAEKRHPGAQKVEVIQAATMQRFPWLVHGFSTRTGGVSACYGDKSLNLGHTKQDAGESVQENRKRLLVAVGAATRNQPWPLIVNRQIHSDVIHVVRTLPSGLLVGDGLITNLPGVTLAVQTADCIPVLVVDTANQVMGTFHAGWRGTVRRIVEKSVGVMRREFGSRPKDIYAAIGPGIQQCCYEVGEEVRQEFESQFPWACKLFREVKSSDAVRDKYPLLFMNARAPGHGDDCAKLHLDLPEANRRQLLAAGVSARHITVLDLCTACDTRRFFSHRAEKGNTGRMMAVIGITP
jgi:purine-nucleoside/S-methyl-5'-thioadenosine phosphorylase / adenosine deaminase